MSLRKINLCNLHLPHSFPPYPPPLGEGKGMITYLTKHRVINTNQESHRIGHCGLLVA
jgi:hypothetical protein